MNEASRREFLAAGTMSALGGVILGGQAALAAEAPSGGHANAMKSLFPGAVDKDGKYVLPPLPYPYDALSEVIDEQTLKIHHDKHHDAYVKGLIKAEEELAKARQDGNYDLVAHWSKQAAFHGGGHFLHTLFWVGMAPPAEVGEPNEALKKGIEKDFGSFDAMLAHLKAATKAVEGSGWGVLAWSIAAGKLVILQTQNHQLLSQWANVPLLVVDVWEHAYYLKYQNNRAAFVDAFPKVINWKGISERFERLVGQVK